MIGPDTVAACITDGGADWTACESMVRSKFPWIFFIHCAGHVLSLILKDICCIEEVHRVYMGCTWGVQTIFFCLFFYFDFNNIHHVQIAELVANVTAAQHWFNTNKTKALVAAATKEHYNCMVIRVNLFSQPTLVLGGKFYSSSVSIP